ncbi:MAG TPA: DUF4278 domain-containing protein [Microcoleaceae cyanobacterium]|jgi:hypothetical protein
MRLSYRGTAYESVAPAIEVTESHLTGMYRGVPTRVTSSASIPLPQSTFRLSYRGTHYLGLR